MAMPCTSTMLPGSVGFRHGQGMTASHTRVQTDLLEEPLLGKIGGSKPGQPD